MAYVRAEPFRAFRVVLEDGQTCEVRQPRMIGAGCEGFLLFHAEMDEESFESFDQFGLCVVSGIEHVEADQRTGL